MSIHSRFVAMVGLCAMALSLVAKGALAQDPLANAPLAPESVPHAKGSAKSTTDSASKADAKSKSSARPEFILKSPAEWRKILTKTQFAVARQKMTEPPFTGKYASGHFHGIFVCACCDAAHVRSELFSSQAKFDSGTGWPSFFQAYNGKSLQTAWDYLEAEPRVEVMCRRCGAHLGHVFDDGPPPTGLRFCINSEVIKLVPPEGEASSKGSASRKTAAHSRSKAKSKPGAKSASKQAAAGKTTESGDSQAAPAGEKPTADSSRGTSAS